MKTEELKYHLDAFIGSERFFRHGLNRKVIYTEGVEFFAKAAKAYWLIDAIAVGVNGLEGPVPSAIPHKDRFGVVILDVEQTDTKRFAILEVLSDYDENDENVGEQLWAAKIDHTDCPVGIWKFYLVDDGENITLLLPAEY